VLANGQAADLAARYGEERYRVLARGDVASAMASLERRGLVERVLPLETTADGWSLHECTIAGDPSRSAMVLRGIVDRGVDVARLERVETSLADLITRIIGANSEGSEHA
jgi:hypothetical protein